MASTNQSPEFLAAQKRYNQAYTDEEKLVALEEMMSTMPKHKAGEGMRANIKSRYKALKESMERKVRQKKSTARKEGIKKEGVQIALIGFSGAGKSSLLKLLTNASPLIADYPFVTKSPIIGALKYEGILFQIIDMPAVNYESFDSGVANTADILLIIVTSIQDIDKILPSLSKSCAKRIIVYNKTDLLSLEEKRKLDASLKSRKYNFLIISSKTGEGIDELKRKFVENSGIIRIYTKQPGKPQDEFPVIMQPESKIEDLARKLFPKTAQIKEIKLTGPSSKFANQKVGIEHVLKDKDIVEFNLR